MKSVRILLLAVATLCALIALCACGGGADNTPEHIHEFGEWETTKYPTCTEDGAKVRYCSCGETQNASLPATKHNVVISEATAPTCTSTGLTAGKHCSVCNEVLLAQQTIPEVAHTYDDKYDETCNECGFVRDADCAHAETETIKGYAATCKFAGLTDGEKCKKCGEILVAQVAINIVPHTEVIDQAVAATCTTVGLTEGKHCSTCGVIFTEQTVIPAKGHSFGNWVIVKEDTVYEEGLKERYCECGEKESENIPAKVSKDLAFTLNDDKRSYSVTGIGTCTDTDVVIPRTYDGKPVTSISNNAFYGCSSLTSIVIPDSVTSIGYYAFRDCSSLISIVIPDSVASIGDYAFYNCSELQFNEYENCKYLGSKDNPYYALIEVTTKNLGSYTIHEDAKVIVDGAFSFCSKLTSIVIPYSVTNISVAAFQYCSSLTSAVIGKSVTSIGDFAFNGCTGLKDVYYTGTEAEWAKISIGNYNSDLRNATIHYSYTGE